MRTCQMFLSTVLACSLLVTVARAAFVVELIPNAVPETGMVTISISGGGFQEKEYQIELQDIHNETNKFVDFNATYMSSSELSLYLPHALTPSSYLVNVVDTLEWTLLAVHDGYSVTSFSGRNDGNGVYSVVGLTKLTIAGTGFFPSKHVLVKFEDSARGESRTVAGEYNAADGSIDVEIPVWKTPFEWKAGCPASDDLSSHKSSTCVSDLPVNLTVSLDGGMSYSAQVSFVFGYVKPIKIGFMFLGEFDDFGWNYLLNEGRRYIQAKFGASIDTSVFYTSVAEGEFAFEQDNLGSTLQTGTPVTETVGGKPNHYYPGFKTVQQFCDEGFDLVFTGSFGFMSQVMDVSRDYAPCGRPTAAAPHPPHTTYFVNAGSYLTNSIYSTMFGKIYQMRYLAGIVAGAALAAPPNTTEASSRGNKCVGYIGAYPLPEVQRGMNAFLLGCQKVFPDCKVKVMWTGSWGDDELESDAASFMYHIAECDIIAQHSDTKAPGEYFAHQGAMSIGYNSDTAALLGDSVLTAPMLNWGPMFAHFVDQMATNSWNATEREPELNGAGWKQEQHWPGYDEAAVKLVDRFSPRVSKVTIDLVHEEATKLQQAKGAEAFKHIFCGPLKKRWVYRYEYDDDGNEKTSGPRHVGCGGQADWKRLDTAEQVNLRHYRDSSFAPLPANLTQPRADDCLWGVNFPGEALLFVATVFGPFDEDLVFSDFLLDGIELFEPIATDYGTVHGKDDHGCFTGHGTTGDRFYSPPRTYPKCDNSQWKYEMQTCDSDSLTNAVLYSWVDEDYKCGLDLPSNVNEFGKILVPAELPLLSPALYPECSYIPVDSTIAMILRVMAYSGMAVQVTILVLLIKNRRAPIISTSHPISGIIYNIGGLAQLVATLFSLGENTSTSCLSTPFIKTIPFSVMFGALLIREYRVWKLMVANKSLKRMRWSDSTTIVRVCYVTAVPVIVCIAMAISDPPRLEQESVHVTETLVVQQNVCATHTEAYGLILQVYRWLVLLVGVYLGYACRHIAYMVPDAKAIFLTLINRMLWLFIVSTVTGFVDSVKLSILLNGLADIVGSLVGVVSIMGTKLLYLDLTKEQLMLTSINSTLHSRRIQSKSMLTGTSAGDEDDKTIATTEMRIDDDDDRQASKASSAKVSSAKVSPKVSFH